MTELPTKNGTQYCEVGHQVFRDLINSRFKVPGDLVSTASNIYHFVRDEIKYEDYSNTRKGVFRTLQERYGNCCDQAHLLVALLRTAEIPTYYAHGKDHWRAVPCIENNIIVIRLIEIINLEVQIIIMVVIIIDSLCIIL